MRKWLKEIREKLDCGLEEMARRCETSPTLLEMIEEFDALTHPKIAARIADEYKLTVERYNELIPTCHAASKVPKREPRPVDSGSLFDEEADAV